MQNYTKSLYRAITQWLNKNGPFKDYKEIYKIEWNGESMDVFYLSKDDKWCNAYLRYSRQEMINNLLNE